MVPEGFVRRGGEVEVVPDESFVVGSDDDVVYIATSQHYSSRDKGNEGRTSERMNVDGGDPLESRIERLNQRLSEEIVDPNIALRSDEEMRSRGMESDALNFSFLLLERRLRLMLRQLMNEDRSISRCVYRRQ